MPEPEDVHVEDHRAFRTYGFVAGAVIVLVLNWLDVIPNAYSEKLVGLCILGAMASIRYGQVQDAKVVKTALKKQEKVVKAAIVEAEAKECEEQEKKTWQSITSL